MTEHQLFTPGEFPFTPEWYETREHAPHLEQGAHADRLRQTAEVIGWMKTVYDLHSVVDLGAGDGGLLSTLDFLNIPVWGYDLMKVNVDYAKEVRGVQVEYLDFVNSTDVVWADLAVITECLEHLEDPHALVRRIGRHCKYIVASSPAWETPESHDGCHAWAFDQAGYEALIEQGKFMVVHHRVTDGYGFQIVGAVRV